MKIIQRILSTVLALLLILSPSSKALPTGDGSGNPRSQQSADPVSPTLSQPSANSAYPKKADLEYFRSVTEATTYKEVFRDIGPADYITGSGIITYHWNLDDGSVAKMTFYIDHVMTLFIVKDGKISEGIVW